MKYEYLHIGYYVNIHFTSMNLETAHSWTLASKSVNLSLYFLWPTLRIDLKEI